MVQSNLEMILVINMLMNVFLSVYFAHQLSSKAVIFFLEHFDTGLNQIELRFCFPIVLSRCLFSAFIFNTGSSFVSRATIGYNKITVVISYRICILG